MSDIVDYRLDQLEKKLDVAETNMKEVFMELGKLHQKAETDARLARIESKNSEQDRQLGAVFEGLEGIRRAMAASSDMGMAEAAAGITINVEGGQGGSGGSISDVDVGK